MNSVQNLYESKEDAGKRRSLLGSKKTPLLFSFKKQIPSYRDEELTNYLQLVNGTEIIVTKIKQEFRIRIQGANQSKLHKIYCSDIVVLPITGTSSACIIAGQTLHILNGAWDLIKVDGLVLFNYWAIHFFLNGPVLYLFAGDQSKEATHASINVYSINQTYHITKIASWNIGKNGVFSFATFRYKNIQYLSYVDYTSAYYTKFELKNLNEEPKVDGFKKIKGLNFNNSNQMPQFILNSDSTESLILITFEKLLLVPYTCAVDENSIKTILSIPLYKIAHYLGIESYSIIVQKQQAFTLTDKHIVFISKKRNVKISNDLSTVDDNSLRGDTLVAISLKTLKPSMIKLMHGIKAISIFSLPKLKTIMIASKQCLLSAEYQNENDPTDHMEYRQQLSLSYKAWEPSNVMTTSQIVYHLIEEKDYLSAVTIIENCAHNKTNKTEKTALSAIRNDLAINIATTNKSYRFEPYFSNTDNDELKQISISIQQRAFSDVLKVPSNTLIEKSPQSPTLSRYKTELGYYSDVLNGPESELYNSKIAIISPKSIGDFLLTQDPQSQYKVLQKLAPFIVGRLGADTVVPLTESAMLNGNSDLSTLYCLLVTKEPKAVENDSIISNLINRYRPVFGDKLYLKDAFTSAGMVQCAALIKGRHQHRVFSVRETVEDSPKPMTRSEIKAHLQGLLEKQRELMHSVDTNSRLLSCRELIPRAPPSFEPTDCAICHSALNGDDRITFPCKHSFHEGCLVKRLLQILDGMKLFDLKRLLSKQRTPEDEAMFDDILLEDCPICGQIAVRTIKVPTIDFGSPPRFPIFR